MTVVKRVYFRFIERLSGRRVVLGCPCGRRFSHCTRYKKEPKCSGCGATGAFPEEKK